MRDDIREHTISFLRPRVDVNLVINPHVIIPSFVIYDSPQMTILGINITTNRRIHLIKS